MLLLGNKNERPIFWLRNQASSHRIKKDVIDFFVEHSHRAAADVQRNHAATLLLVSSLSIPSTYLQLFAFVGHCLGKIRQNERDRALTTQDGERKCLSLSISHRFKKRICHACHSELILSTPLAANGDEITLLCGIDPKWNIMRNQLS
jgi:hypothetical protein